MATASRTFGSYTVSILQDGILTPPSSVITHPDGEKALQDVLAHVDGPELHLVINCFLLQGPEGTILIDTGAGTLWGPDYGKARTALKAAGVDPHDVDKILITHVHGDHVAGLFEAGAAYFPNAQIYVPDTDLTYFSDKAILATTPEQRRGAFAMADLLTAQYQSRLHRFQQDTLFDEISAVRLPGHTPGHVGFVIGSSGDQVLILADALHLATLQPEDPRICLVYDQTPDQAIASRKLALAKAVDEGLLVAGSHIEGFNRVRRVGEGFSLERLV